jgi:NAD+ kinase
VTTPSFRQTSTSGSARPSPSAVRRAAVVTHGKPQTIGPALERLRAVAAASDVALLFTEEEAEKHEVAKGGGEVRTADVAVVLGGDGTMLRALQSFLGTGVPVIGVNFGRVGFLASMGADELEEGLRRVFAGDYRVVELPTLEVEVEGRRGSALNDVVVLSSVRGRMVELHWALGGEDLGVQPCDGMICATSTGSTAYNLSNGGPVLVRGLDAMVITFIAAHSLHARPMVVPRGLELVIRNRTADVPASVITDGHRLAEVAGGAPIAVRLGDGASLLATLPEATFFRRYRETFGS